MTHAKKGTCKVVVSTKHINPANDNINLTKEGTSNNKQAFLYCGVSLKRKNGWGGLVFKLKACTSTFCLIPTIHLINCV